MQAREEAEALLLKMYRGMARTSLVVLTETIVSGGMLAMP